MVKRMNKLKKNKIDQQVERVEEQIRKSSACDAKILLDKLKVNKSGLKPKDVEIRLNGFGKNVVEANKPPKWYHILWISFYNPFNLILMFLLVVAFLTSDLRTVIVMGAMVFISTALRFWQEMKAIMAAETLKKIVNNKVTVTRYPENKAIFKSKRMDIPVEEVVPGDIVNLSAGDMIPGDLRLLSTKDLFISQSTMTGEALPIEKHEDLNILCADDYSDPKSAKDNKKFSILDIKNMCYMGTTVVSGIATGVVLTTGNNTYFGSMASNLLGKRPETAFDKGVNNVSKLLIKFMLVMVPVVFVLNGLFQHDWSDAFLFAISVAVGLTPEMLPMIVNTGLAKGAIAMAKKKTVVKQLSAIQNFGAIDILCTDKTGTLTQDNVVLIKHMNADGEKSSRVLNYAYLNSYFQTGLKNLLDKAVVKKTKKENMNSISNEYTLIDEIPFDFVRRRMSVILKNKRTKEINFVCKGAVEETLSKCTHFEDKDGNIVELDTKAKNKITELKDGLSEDGLRVIAVAHKKINDWQEDCFKVDDEKELVFAGYIAFLDPPKESAVKALKKLKEHRIRVKVLTGDNALVAGKICRDVGLRGSKILTGPEIDKISEENLYDEIKNVTIFAKLSPMNKARIVRSLKNHDHIVGFMGDGINDALALREADVGISVDTGVDLAKEAADIILLEKSLLVLEKGVIEGRKTFGNIMKYIKITASSNFGNVFSVMVASVFIPFLPMMPIMLLLQNLLYDSSCIAIPWDKMDKSFVKRPRKWNAASIATFMVCFGPISSIFDILTYILMWFVFKANCDSKQALFQTGWFVVGLTTQTLIIHMIRTEKIPFIQSRAAFPLIIMTIFIIIIGVIIPFTAIGHSLGLVNLPYIYFAWWAGILTAYALLTQLLKTVYIKIFKTLI
ncbi:MAG: magnesium-translocating P-type ATPase [bacterium]|nr:magnesium-translocating P-type ATPase [bacterium]